MLLIWIIKSGDHTGIAGAAGVQLICINPEGTNPHSAIFRLKLPVQFKGQADRFMLDFGDGRVPAKISVLKLLTHYYEIPGRYYPVLLYDNFPLDTVSVYLQTTGWTATANMQSDSTRVYPLPDQNLIREQGMKVSTEELYHAGVDTNHTFFVHFVNATPTGISGDDFELNTELRTSRERPGVRCSQVNIAIYGEASRHLLKVMKAGCASFNGLQFSENMINGASEDLRVVSTDLSNGGSLKLQVKSRQGKFWINSKQVYQASYNIPLGKIYGIEILFSGIGEVHDFRLKDLKTGITFNEGFDKEEPFP